MRKHIYSLLILSLTSFGSIAQTKPSPAILRELENAEKNMFDATSRGDSAAFRKLSGKDYFTLNANGESMTLDQAVKFTPRFKGSTVSRSEQKVRVFDKFALRTGRAKIYIGDQQVVEILYTSGWSYRYNEWLFVHRQGML